MAGDELKGIAKDKALAMEKVEKHSEVYGQQPTVAFDFVAEFQMILK